MSALREMKPDLLVAAYGQILKPEVWLSQRWAASTFTPRYRNTAGAARRVGHLEGRDKLGDDHQNVGRAMPANAAQKG